MGANQFKQAARLLELEQGKPITMNVAALGVLRSKVSAWVQQYENAKKYLS